MSSIPIAAPDVGEAAIRRVREVLESGYLAAGEEVAAFETEFADYCDAAHGVATSNGTTALHAALRALDVGEGDRVVTTPFSFAASANAIRLCGAGPVFADVDPRTFNLDPDAVEAVVREEDVDAVLVVHLFGLPADMDRLVDVADEHDLALIEDAAQAHGAAYDGRHVGSFGDAGCFSFYPTKNVTTGEGGMVVTDRGDVAERARRFIDHGQTERYTHVSVGHNFRMTNIAAAIGRSQLEHLDDYVATRRANAARLTEALPPSVEPPVEPAGTRHAYNQYTVRTDDRDGLREHLDSHGVGTRIYYPTPIHEQPAYEGFDPTAPVAEQLAEEVLSLPVHPGLSEADLATIESALAAYSPHDESAGETDSQVPTEHE